jgi:hypothetical protein
LSDSLFVFVVLSTFISMPEMFLKTLPFNVSISTLDNFLL